MINGRQIQILFEGFSLSGLTENAVLEFYGIF